MSSPKSINDWSCKFFFSLLLDEVKKCLDTATPCHVKPTASRKHMAFWNMGIFTRQILTQQNNYVEYFSNIP